MFQRNSLLLGNIFWKCHSFNLFDSVFWSCYFVRMLKMMLLRTASSRVQLLLLKFSIYSLSIILCFVCLGTLTSTEFMLIVTSSWWTDVFIVCSTRLFLSTEMFSFEVYFVWYDKLHFDWSVYWLHSLNSEQLKRCFPDNNSRYSQKWQLDACITCLW